ncbi:hypothetical protein PR202_gb21142 [Eleusine coracana subsp. coracana]|uniref:Pre-mRNA-splicing factor 18 n=1 Tax=Eleusine coracana subsp. coracana TaxID=191504 RepID=A0AAV5FEE6_ELECO|nr:hypothetical protein QOZ80_7BG0602680 [Eleusine coracana subsp. coracana]GJN32626.1 hypothetical protein PR202_gb21142 [Eleusine coracana subsp. coracana]
MDLLKGELQRKRKAAADDFAGKGFVRRSELEQKQLQKRRDAHRTKLLAKAREPARSSAASDRSEPGPAADDPAPSSSSAAEASSVAHPAPDLPRHEVVRRLRVLRQPVTLFGEDDAARAERFKAVLKYGLFHDVDDIDIAEGQTNEFLRDVIQTRKRRKVAAGRDTSSSGRHVGGGAGANSAVEDDGDGDDDDEKRMNANFEELREEDRILVFFKRLLNEWKQELDAMTEVEKGTADGKLMLATFNQRARDLNPLFHLCRKKVVPDDIRQALLVIVECCMKHNYLAASEQYIKLAIGNAPWPIGVTMVGIHERSAREKIHAKSVAHIMNDETTRRYLQSIKRLMTRCQPHYPAQPSNQ